MHEMGKLLFVAGLVLAAVGLVFWLGPSWLGRLPGDIHYRRGNVSVHAPIVTCLILSVIVSVLAWLFRR